MNVRVGEVASNVEVQRGSDGGARDGDGRSPAIPGWSERERQRTVAEAVARDRARVAEEGFDG